MDPINQIVIQNPEAITAMLERMEQRGLGAAFQSSYMRLLALFAQYLAWPYALPGHWRTATVWATEREPNDFFWLIEQFAPVGQPELRRIVLGGTLHFHESDQTWGIHT